MADSTTEKVARPSELTPKDIDEGIYEDVVDHAAEKKIVRKMDRNLITVFGALYLMSFLGMVLTPV